MLADNSSANSSLFTLLVFDMDYIHDIHHNIIENDQLLNLVGGRSVVSKFFFFFFFLGGGFWPSVVDIYHEEQYGPKHTTLRIPRKHAGSIGLFSIRHYSFASYQKTASPVSSRWCSPNIVCFNFRDETGMGHCRLSNAFEKSRNNTSIECPSSISLVISSRNSNKFVKHDQCGRNPCCDLFFNWWSWRCRIRIWPTSHIPKFRLHKYHWTEIKEDWSRECRKWASLVMSWRIFRKIKGKGKSIPFPGIGLKNVSEKLLYTDPSQHVMRHYVWPGKNPQPWRENLPEHIL